MVYEMRLIRVVYRGKYSCNPFVGTAVEPQRPILPLNQCSKLPGESYSLLLEKVMHQTIG